MWILGCRERLCVCVCVCVCMCVWISETDGETKVCQNIMRHKNRNESTVFYKEIINAHSQNEHESVITECLSQTQRVTNLLRLQNTTFQTCSRSKYSPIIPRLIFKASLFSPSFLPPQIPEPRAAEWESERQRRWGEHLNLAFLCKFHSHCRFSRCFRMEGWAGGYSFRCSLQLNH